MFIKFLKGFLTVVLVAGMGFTSGYFSDMVIKKIIPADFLTGFKNYIAAVKDGRPETQPDKGESGTAGEAGSNNSAAGGSETNNAATPENTAAESADSLYPAAGEVQELQETDLALGGLKMGDNRSQVEKTMGQSVKIHKSYDRQTGQNVRTFENGRMIVKWGKKTGVFSIAVTAPGTITPRGLKIGDPVSKAYQLYGRPAADQGGLAAYKSSQSGTDALLIKYANNKVVEIKVTKEKN